MMSCLFSSAQTSYSDSLIAFHTKYITELFPVIKKDTAFIRFYPVDPSFKFIAKVEILKAQKVFNMTTSSGKAKEAQKYALISFRYDHKTYRLFAYQLMALKNSKEQAGYFFIPFLDKTSHKESYAGGRYMDFEIKDIQNNTLYIDFNKAYNPYCAFTTGYNCPIPPRENTLPITVRAGERYLSSQFHK